MEIIYLCLHTQREKTNIYPTTKEINDAQPMISWMHGIEHWHEKHLKTDKNEGWINAMQDEMISAVCGWLPAVRGWPQPHMPKYMGKKRKRHWLKTTQPWWTYDEQMKTQLNKKNDDLLMMDKLDMKTFYGKEKSGMKSFWRKEELRDMAPGCFWDEMSRPPEQTAHIRPFNTQ